MRGFYKICHYSWTIVLLLAGWGCSSDDAANQKNMAPVERLDPYSAPLYPAQSEAEAKNFTVELTSGEEFTLSDHQGQVVLLNIWATWCAPCREETPELVNLYTKYREQGFLVLGVSIDEQGMSVVKPFMDEFDVNYPMVIDDGTIMDKYGPTMGIPTSYIIGRKGFLRYFAVGAVTNKELEPRIQKLLNEDTEQKKS